MRTLFSEEGIKKFIHAFDFEYINNGTWKLICERILQGRVTGSSKNANEERYTAVVDEIKHAEGQEFNGIMRHLTDEAGGNIHDSGTVNITSNSISGSSCHPKNLVDYQHTSCYASNRDSNTFLCFSVAVNLTSYTMQSNKNSNGSNNIKNWVIEASNDKQSWEEIDSHQKDLSLRGPNIIHPFTIKKQNNNFYRYIRLRQTGENMGIVKQPKFLVLLYGILLKT